MSALMLLLLSLSAGAQSVSGQSTAPGTPTPDKAPTFEVASIKPNKSGSNSTNVGFQSGGRFSSVNVSLQSLVRNAYRLQPFQMIGGPAWFAVDRFDIVAKADSNASTTDMIEMVKALLADRFKLVFHRETRELPIYELVRLRTDGTLGPRLKQSAMDCAAVMTAAPAPASPTPAPPDARPTCGMRNNTDRTGSATVVAGGALLAQLASSLSNLVGRTVVDKTSLSGGYDLDLSFIVDATVRPGDAPPVAADGPSLFTALQEQLGLKLESAKGPVEVLVIDSAEKPAED